MYVSAATEFNLEVIRRGFLKGGLWTNVAFREVDVALLVADKGRRSAAGMDCESGVAPVRNVDFRFMN